MVPLNVEQYRALFEAAPSLVWRSGTDGLGDFFNATWLAFTGRTLEQELGDGWIEGVHPEDRARAIAAYREHFERREPCVRRYRLRRYDGEYRHVLDRAAPYHDAAGAFGGLIGSCVDVGDGHGRAVSSGAEELFEMSLDNVCIAGLDGYFKRVNPSWTRTLGWTAEELLSKPSVEFVHPEDRAGVISGREKLRAGSPIRSLVNRYLCKDGTYRWLEWRSVAHLDRQLVYAVARDITEQKLAEERLRAATAQRETLQRQLIFADRMASVGTLAGGVAHEINNPLACVASNLTVLVEELQSARAPLSPERVAELTEVAVDAQSGAERIHRIVRGLRTFSRAEEERRTVLEVQPLLELSISMTFNEIRHRARLVKDYGAMPLVLADEARLGQVFINLLVNAAQALPEGASAANEVRIVTSTDALGRAVIEVQDTGAGIPATLIDRIFDPFFTTKPVGVATGLGLSICHSIVIGLGGELTVSSEEGQGASFRVALPAAASAVRDAAARPEPSRTAVSRAAVLVVDDEPAVGVALRRVLRHHEVTVVTGARQALDLLGFGKHFDVIFLDLMMPDISGMDFFDSLTRSFPDAAGRVVLMTGGAFTPSAKAFLDRVSNPRIDKPFDVENVRRMVQRRVG